MRHLGRPVIENADHNVHGPFLAALFFAQSDDLVNPAPDPVPYDRGLADFLADDDRHPVIALARRGVAQTHEFTADRFTVPVYIIKRASPMEPMECVYHLLFRIPE